ncbi:MAG: RNA polymerase sigma factor [Alphaproteobacteria bacterium]|nr:RNA polymerase sigma factor [Alphaproteobacteria bacterium]
MESSQRGDQLAYAMLLRELLPLLRRVVGRKWRSPQDVEDIVQDILLSVHSVRHTYDPGRPFMPWLMTIASRRIADTARRRSSRSANETTVEIMPETSSLDDTKNEQDVSDDRQELLAALSELSPSQREAVQLMKIEGLSLEEASIRTGRSVASLKVTVHRALKALRQSLEQRN